MNYVYLGIFVVFAALHLYASLKQNLSLRRTTKPLLLLSLLGFYLETMHLLGKEPSTYLIVAVLLSWLGDVLLIPNGKKWFATGGSAFLASHAFFIVAYIDASDYKLLSLPFWVYIVVGVLFATISVFSIIKFSKFLDKKMCVLVGVYIFFNAVMNSFAMFRAISYGQFTLVGLVTVIGALLFLISDITLMYVRFKKDTVFKTHFPVMLPYLIAEFLIVLSFIL